MASSFALANEDEDIFLNSEKVVSIVNLLTKFKAKLWELPNLDDSASTSVFEVKL